MEPVNVAIIYYSSTGTVHTLAQAAAEGAEKAGANVRLRKVAETASPEAVSANPAWAQHLQDTADGGQESTLLALGNTFYHWGGIIVPPGYTDPIQFQSGNPYGASHVTGDGPPSEVGLQAARYHARRVVDTVTALKAGRAASKA